MLIDLSFSGPRVENLAVQRSFLLWNLHASCRVFAASKTRYKLQDSH